MKATLAYPWTVFDRLQKESESAPCGGPHEEAVTAALAYILDRWSAGAIPPTPSQLEADLHRVMASAARRHRYREALVRVYMPEQPLVMDGAGEALVSLGKIMAPLAAAQAAVILDVGMGFTDEEIARRRRTTAGAVRARVFRIRQKLAA